MAKLRSDQLQEMDFHKRVKTAMDDKPKKKKKIRMLKPGETRREDKSTGETYIDATDVKFQEPMSNQKPKKTMQERSGMTSSKETVLGKDLKKK